MRNIEAGEFALTVTSPEFVNAKNAVYADGELFLSEAIEQNAQLTVMAEDIVLAGVTTYPGHLSPVFEMRRQAALKALTDDGFARSAQYGFFEAVRDPLSDVVKPSNMTKDDLGLGEIGPVQTNARIIGLFRSGTYEAPELLLERSLQIIQKHSAYQRGVGPENYATGLKLFSDMVKDSDDKLDADRTKELLGRWTEGFDRIGKKDQPNFIELTNIYTAVRSLPRDVFTPQFARTLVRFTLEALPTFSRDVLLAELNAMGKLKIGLVEREAAMLTDLSIVMLGPLQRTKDFRIGLHAIANLEPSAATNRALRNVFQNGAQIETASATIEDLIDTATSLRSITQNSIKNPLLIAECKKHAELCAQTAIRLYKKAEHDPATQHEDLARLKAEVQQVAGIFQSM